MVVIDGIVLFVLERAALAVGALMIVCAVYAAAREAARYLARERSRRMLTRRARFRR